MSLASTSARWGLHQSHSAPGTGPLASRSAQALQTHRPSRPTTSGATCEWPSWTLAPLFSSTPASPIFPPLLIRPPSAALASALGCRLIARRSTMLNLLSLTDSPLFNVWEHILGDLPTHVSLSQTCRRLRDVYSKDDSKWQAALFSAGYGFPIRRMTTDGGAGAISDLSWRRLACILVRHGAVCEIGSCTRANACFGEYTFSLCVDVRPLRPHRRR